MDSLHWLWCGDGLEGLDFGNDVMVMKIKIIINDIINGI